MDERIKKLNEIGIKCSAIERILSLPQGCMQSWEKGKMQPEEEALLNMIYAFPWLLSLAEKNYKGKIKFNYTVELTVTDLNHITNRST